MVKPKERIKMPEQDPLTRIKNFSEVPLGYTNIMAKEEAERCLQCGDPKCIEGCPVNIDIPGFIILIKEEKYREAVEFPPEHPHIR